MDEIERILKENRLAKDFDTQRILGDYAFSKSDIKHLIELVENEQVQKCLEVYAPSPYSDYRMSNDIRNSPRVSEQIDWEEL